MFLFKNRGEVYCMPFLTNNEGIVHRHDFEEFNSTQSSIRDT